MASVLLPLQVVNHYFGRPPNRWAADYREPFWPAVADERHGYVRGLRLLPLYAAMSDEEFAQNVKYGLAAGA